MVTYLERYRHGDREQVWAELTAMGSAIDTEPVYADALAVASTTMSRAGYNFFSIRHKLVASGYQFSSCSSIGTVLLPNTKTKALIENIEHSYGLLPLSVKAWFEIVGEVNLQGSHPDWKVRASCEPDWDYTQVVDSRISVAVEPLNLLLARSAHHFPVEWIDYCSGEVYPEHSFDLTIGDGRRGDDSLTVIVGKMKMDSCLLYGPPLGRFDKYRMEPIETFVQYLRRSFEWGGFPGFAKVPEELRPTEMLNYLREGLLPI